MKRVLIYLIEKYQKHISFFLDNKGIKCKFYPSCSEYMKQAIMKYGIIKEHRKTFKPVCDYIHKINDKSR